MHPYGLIVGIALVIYYQLTFIEWIKAGINKVNFTPIFVFALLFSLLGARLYHVADNWGYYRVDPWLIPQIWNGGLGIIGALLFTFCFLLASLAWRNCHARGRSGLFISKAKHLSTLTVFNIFCTHLLLVLGLGRLANLFSSGGFWLESISLIVAYLIWLKIKHKGSDFSISYFLISYGIIRIFSDRFRTDLWFATKNLPVSTIVAVLMVLGGLTLAFTRRVRSKVDGQT